MRTIPLLTLCSLLVSSHALAGRYSIADIYINNKKIDRITLKHFEEQSRDGEDNKSQTTLHINGKTCKIKSMSTLEKEGIFLSSDANFLILYDYFVDISDTSSCEKLKPERKSLGGFLEDINKKKGIMVYTGPYDLDWQCDITTIKRLSDGKYMDIAAKPFYSSRKSSKNLHRSSYAAQPKLSPDGNYLALSTPSFSCRKGAYPGVYNTNTWKQVIFTTPDVDAKCAALFPNLPPPDLTIDPTCKNGMAVQY